MQIINLALDGVAWVGAFVVVHLVISLLLRDTTNIDFWTSIFIALVPSYILYYGIPIAGSLLSLKGALMVGIAILSAWKTADIFTHLVWWEDLLVGFVAVISYLFLYYGSWWVWNQIAQT